MRSSAASTSSFTSWAVVTKRTRALLAGGESEADEQVALAGSGVAEQHDGLAGVL
jgi:hypothetical protein